MVVVVVWRFDECGRRVGSSDGGAGDCVVVGVVGVVDVGAVG